MTKKYTPIFEDIKELLDNGNDLGSEEVYTLINDIYPCDLDNDEDTKMLKNIGSLQYILKDDQKWIRVEFYSITDKTTDLIEKEYITELDGLIAYMQRQYLKLLIRLVRETADKFLFEATQSANFLDMHIIDSDSINIFKEPLVDD